MNLLFVCTENKLRSATAEQVFSEYEGVESIGAGTNKDAATHVSGDLVEWADIIFAMENTHKNKISKKFQPLLKNKRLICLDIPDNYKFMDPVLIELLKKKLQQHVAL